MKAKTTLIRYNVVLNDESYVAYSKGSKLIWK